MEGVDFVVVIDFKLGIGVVIVQEVVVVVGEEWVSGVGFVICNLCYIGFVVLSEEGYVFVIYFFLKVRFVVQDIYMMIGYLLVFNILCIGVVWFVLYCINFLVFLDIIELFFLDLYVDILFDVLVNLYIYNNVEFYNC